MPNKELGIADPIYDALRVRSGQSIAPDLGGGSTGAGGIENKIYVWHADGSSIDTFDPDAAGLALAIAAAVSGDTVWLPSIPIALTAGVTVPVNVTLTGISDNAALSFSAFSGTAITLSDGAALIGFTVTMTSNGATAIGVDATAQNTLLQHMTITASGGSTLNIAVDTGYSASPIASEIWAGAQSEIFWRTVGGNWNLITTLPDAGFFTWFGITNDGATAYAATHPTGNQYEYTKIYKCTNIKAGTPTWNLILQIGDSAAGQTITEYFGYAIGPMTLVGNKLYTICHVTGASEAWAYGEYDGLNWAWSRTINDNPFKPDGVGPQIYALNRSVLTSGNVLIDYQYGIPGFEMYRSPASSVAYHSVRTGAHLYIRSAGVNLQDFGASSFDIEVKNTKIFGAENGPQICVVASSSNHLWISDDGSTFSDIAAWAEGYVRDEIYNGGGTLIWIPLTIANGATFCRRYVRTGLSNTDLTSNLWSLTTGIKSIIGMGLVYA